MINPIARRRAAWYSLAVATTLVVTGCTSGGDGASSGSTSADSSPQPSATTVTPGATPAPPSSGSTTPGLDPSAPATPGQAIASREFTVAGTYTPTRVRMRFDAVELKRRGDLLDLTATLTNLEQYASRDLRWQVSTRFAGPYRKDISTGDVFSGAVLTDRAGKKRYLVAADSGRHCVCTEQLSSTFVGAGQSIELSATYAAPPESTTELDVAVTSLGTFRDLPVS